MANETARRKSKQALSRRIKVNGMWEELSVEVSDQANEKRERYLVMLNKRHNNPDFKAEEELKRLVKQFHRINLRLGIQRVWPKLKNPNR